MKSFKTILLTLAAGTLLSACGPSTPNGAVGNAAKAFPGLGTLGGGALHALLAIGEMEFASRYLLNALARNSSIVVADHILKRLTRTIV